MPTCQSTKPKIQYMLKSDEKTGGETLPTPSQRGKSPKAGKGVGRKAKAPTIVLSIRIPAAWLDAFDGDKEAAAMYAKNAFEAVVKGGAICP